MQDLNRAWEPHVNQDSHTESRFPHWMLHVNHAQEPHVNQDCSYVTQFFKEDHQNSTWKSLHMSHNIVCSQICHKHIPIMGWKDKASKEIAAYGKFVSLSSCCEKATAGMLRAFPEQFTCSYRELHKMWHVSPRRATKVNFFTPWYLCYSTD